MAIIKVRLKDAGQNTLHPETDWSVVRNKPSIETIEDVHGNVSQKWNANAKGENIEIEGGNVSIYSRDTGISLESSDDIYLSGGNVYINNKRPFTVRHIMDIGGCKFEIFDDQDKTLTMSDLKVTPDNPYLPASGYDISNKRIFYSVRIQSDGIYVWYVKVTNGILDNDTSNYGENVTEIARYVLK